MYRVRKAQATVAHRVAKDCDDDRGNGSARKCEDDDRYDVFEKVQPLHVVARFKDNWRQKKQKEDLFVKPEPPASLATLDCPFLHLCAKRRRTKYEAIRPRDDRAEGT